MNPLFATLPTSIFAHTSQLAAEHDAVNLGQGFPDFGWPEDVVERAAALLREGPNQYPPMRGLPVLREALAEHYRQHQGVACAVDDITITSGATEALAAAILALVSPGEEVVLFQPLYDAYLPMVRRAGGMPRLVTLTPPDWRITAEALDRAIGPKTRLLIFNNPHNPTARMFDDAELALVAQACVRHDLIALSDEVWEHVVFGGRAHRPLSTLPGMAERTVKVGSAGKIFSLTGWKVGWILAPAQLASPIAKAHQYVTFATPPNLQGAVAYGLGKASDYYLAMRSAFEHARDAMVGALRAGGWATLAAEGTYFVCLDLAASGIEAQDVTFCERAVREAGVAAIPVSAFYDTEASSNVVRLCFAKQPGTIAEGVERLSAARDLF
ncbi:MAG TPA: aminotransferase [Allosphingosinicella sp.]|jgi:aspartate/methionine/tyrosine aminotransferase|uniref:aminotransferase n=1 Tax=Allosphingosinicella sp. TaxID=2823234 RepID=UPI002F29B475